MTARIDTSPCPVPAWLPGGHAQTLYGAFCAQHPALHFVRERVDTPDGDFIDLDWCAPHLNPNQHSNGQASPHLSSLVGTAARRWAEDADWAGLTADGPVLVLFHGLEGSSLSPYMQAIAHDFRAAGWIVAAAHFRGCSGVPNRMARAYYSGDSAEIDFIIGHVRARLPRAALHAAGISLGGNALLKLLGESSGTPHGLKAAAAVSAPMDLSACGRRLSDTLWGRQLYSRHFLRSIRRKIFDKAREFPGSVDVSRTQNMRSLREFDDLYTAPMHGYLNALDYWTRAASLPLLPSIHTPTLVLNARNDPFVPEASLPGSRDASGDVLLHQPAQGGHAGFVTGVFPGNLRWLPARLLRFFSNGH
ncbi:MAG: alpha/beta fold hydrolase [Castellaniella sp.]|uniref:YheT family hydrolase n=1 Tax=Castellaniella sp. TaxID=1955812 RepID=UPI002A36D142|nr:alpha/beta fold hydrolase [Castellaniella sp.]MDY0309522.1 alpha/beta fold hydrolase [Castellaniella sp.]